MLIRKTTLVGLAALFAIVLLAATSSPGSSLSGAKTAAPPKSDERGFPRTLSFWKCDPDREVARRDMVVGFGFCNIAELRRLNPKGIFLLTPGLFPASTNGYGGMGVTYGSGLWSWREGYQVRDGGCDKLAGGVNLGCIRLFNSEYDAMWNADGSIALIQNGTAGHPGWNLADPLGKGTRELVAKFFAYTAKVSGLYAKSWDGVFSDNWTYGALGQSWAYGPNLDMNRDGRVDDYGTLRKSWDDGLNEVGTRIRSYLPGKIVAGNGSWFPMWLGDKGATDPQGWLKASNATFVDDMQDFYVNGGGGGPPNLLRIATRWLSFKDPEGLPRYVLFRMKALTNSGELLNIPSDANPSAPEYMLDPGVMRSMRWGLTLSLLAGAYFEITVNNRDDTTWWYDEYDGGKGIRRHAYLGKPLGPPVLLQAGRVWRRNFENGVVLNNSTPKTVSINLKARFRHLRGNQNPSLNNGKVVNRVTVPGHDGLILLDIKK